MQKITIIYVEGNKQKFYYVNCWLYVRPKKSSLVSGNRPGEKKFYYSPVRIVECVSEYLFFIFKKQQTNKQTRIKKSKKN